MLVFYWKQKNDQTEGRCKKHCAIDVKKQLPNFFG